jgi:hypothetical protein
VLEDYGNNSINSIKDWIMKITLNILGVLFLLIGGVWFLQGERVLLGSPMTGQSQWVTYGALLAVVGAGLLLFANLRRKSSPKS